MQSAIQVATAVRQARYPPSKSTVSALYRPFTADCSRAKSAARRRLRSVVYHSAGPLVSLTGPEKMVNGVVQIHRAWSTTCTLVRAERTGTAECPHELFLRPRSLDFPKGGFVERRRPLWNSPPDRVLRAIEYLTAQGVRGERPESARSDCVSSCGPRDQLRPAVLVENNLYGFQLSTRLHRYSTVGPGRFEVPPARVCIQEPSGERKTRPEGAAAARKADHPCDLHAF
jgi:hypothetical protein